MADNILLNFSYGTQAAYDALTSYDEGTLYWTTDTLTLYKGDKLYNGGVRSVPTLPDSPALGVLYILTTTWTGQIWTGTSWKVITKPFVTSIGDTPSDDEVPTAKAVAEYVTNAIANVTGGTGLFVTNISYDTENNLLTVDKGGVVSNVSISGMVHDASYDTTNRKVSLPVVNGTTVEFTIPEDRDLVVKAGKYVSDSEEIWLSIDPTGEYTNASNVIKIPVGDLIDEIQTSNTDTLGLSYDKSNNTISGNVVISQKSNNALQNSNGLYVDISGKLDKIGTTVADQIVITTVDGAVVNSSITLGGTTLGTATNKVAIESAVVNYITTQINEATNYTNSVNTNMKSYVDNIYSNATNYTDTVNANMKSYVDNSIQNAMTWKTF